MEVINIIISLLEVNINKVFIKILQGFY